MFRLFLRRGFGDSRLQSWAAACVGAGMRLRSGLASMTRCCFLSFLPDLHCTPLRSAPPASYPTHLLSPQTTITPHLFQLPLPATLRPSSLPLKPPLQPTSLSSLSQLPSPLLCFLPSLHYTPFRSAPSPSYPTPLLSSSQTTITPHFVQFPLPATPCPSSPSHIPAINY